MGIAGVIVGTYLGRRRGRSLNEMQNEEREDAEKKRENLEKVRVFIADKERVANDDIEALLGVSDATATRYLDELEKEGRVKQVGRTGRHVRFPIKNRQEGDFLVE